MNSVSRLFVGIFLLVVTAACQDDLGGDAQQALIFDHNFDFSVSQHGWEAGFSGHSANPDDTSKYKLNCSYTDLPPSVAQEKKKGILLMGNNRENLFMYIKKKITGLEPNTDYTLTFNAEVASNAVRGSNASQQSTLKAGAVAFEPKSFAQNGFYVMNIDKGNQHEAGENMIVIGDISTSGNSADFMLINRSNSSTISTSYYTPFVARSSDEGEMWLIVGVDSGFKGVNTLYFSKFNAVFSKSKQGS